MKHEAHSIDQILTCWFAIALALTIMIAPKTARSGAYNTGNSSCYGPRWSNDAQHQQRVIAHPDCVTMAPGASAQYIPGGDAYGRPVPPADTPRRYGNSLPYVDLEVKLGTKKIGGKTVKLYADGYAYDPYCDQVTLNGHPLQRDCLASPK